MTGKIVRRQAEPGQRVRAQPQAQGHQAASLPPWRRYGPKMRPDLVVATALTLLALPAMCAAWFRVRRP